MIQIKSLQFSNVLSYGQDNRVDFGDRVVQIVGENGAGKSSIPTILEELFYNKNSRGIKKKDLLNRYTDNKSYEISGEFIKGGSTYRIEKTVASSAKVKLIKDGEDISGHTATQTYNEIESIIGLDFNTFSKLVYQSMVSSLDFLSATDANRKKFLVSLLGLEKYQDIEKQLKEHLKDVKSEISKLEGSETTMKAWLQKNNQIMEKQETLVEPEVDVSLTEKANHKRSEQMNLELHNKLARENLQAEEALQSFLNKPIPEFAERDNKKQEDLSIKSQRLAREYHTAKAENHKLVTADKVCPTCGSELETGISEEQIKASFDLMESIAKQKSEVDAGLEVVKTNNYKAELYTKYKTDKVKFESAYDSTKPTDILDATTLAKEIAEIESEYRAQVAERDRVRAENNRIAQHNAKVDLVLEQRAEFEEDLAITADKLSAKKEVLQILEVLVGAFGSKGLVAYKIESTVKVFEDLINQYLQILADGRFALSFIVEDAKLALKLYDNGAEIDIKSLSSGEFSRVNTATLLAVRKMLTAISKVDINVLFLDEVVSVLDQQGKDTLIEVLLKEHNLNSLVVSHGYQHPLAETLNVIKEDKISRIENG